jgi:hypothetical protein
MKKAALILSALVALSGCADRWSTHAKDGTPLSVAAPECRARAYESAKRQLPFYPFESQPGPAGFPPDTLRDIEYRETALCLKNKGFTMTREWQ